MRILQIVPQSRVGGAESIGFTLAAEFARRGHQTLLLSNRDNGPLLARERPAGMGVRGLPRNSRLDPRIFPFLEGAVRSFRPEIIHAHNYEASIWARGLGFLHPRIAVVVHIHSSRFVHSHGRHRIITDRVFFRRTDAVLALNELQAQFLLDPIGLDPRKLHLVPNGIDTARFSVPGSPSASGANGHQPPGPRGPGNVVCVASLIEVKNHAGLLRAWAKVAATRPHARLTLVGDGPLRGTLEAQTRKLGLGETVTFAGATNDVRPYLWAASVFVLPSHLEALPLSILEAMAAGCAPVASRVGGIPNLLDEDATGLLVPPGDDDALAAALGSLIDDPGRREAIAARATTTVASRFGLAPWLDRIESIYRSCLERRAGRSPSPRD